VRVAAEPGEDRCVIALERTRLEALEPADCHVSIMTGAAALGQRSPRRSPPNADNPELWRSPTMSTNPEPASLPADDLASKLARTEIQHEGSSIPGREIVQVRTEIPCGVESGWHIHPGEEVGYIVAGTVKMMIADKPTLILNAG